MHQEKNEMYQARDAGMLLTICRVVRITEKAFVRNMPMQLVHKSGE